MRVGKAKIIREDGAAWIAFECADLFSARQLVAKLSKFKTHLFELNVSRAKKKRSVDQNRLMWKLCQLIAESIGSTRKEVYRHRIRDWMEPEMICMRSDAVEMFIRNWNDNGDGWIAEAHDSNETLTCVWFWYGSSTFDTGQMTRLIDALFEECSDLGLNTDDERLRSLYEEYQTSKSA